MLNALTDTQLTNILALADDLNDQRQARSTGSIVRGTDITLADISAARADRQPLHNAIEALSDDARHELLALMWTGRGDGFASYSDALVHAKHQSDGGDVPYMVDKVPFPSYVRRGLELLKT